MIERIFRIAKSCHAVTHCVQTVWEKHTDKHEEKLFCKPCTDVVDFVREKNNADLGVDSYMQKYCDFIETDKDKNYCNELVKMYSSEISEILKSKMSSYVSV